MTVVGSRFVKAAILICFCGFVALTWMHSSVYLDSAAADAKTQIKRWMFPPRKLQCPVRAMLCGEKDFGKDAKLSNLDNLRSEFHRLMTTIDFQCPKLQKFGGYDACMTKTTRPNNKSCLVYSFGISNDWSFDEAWARYGCEVHSFDPSMGLQDHIHAPNISFHNLGIWGNDYINVYGWKLKRLATIKGRLGHEKRIIDALKIDAEGAEWPFLRDVIYTDPNGLSNVKQLYMEIHTPQFRSNKNMTETDFAEINDYVRRLRDVHGFQLYRNVQGNNCCKGFSNLMPQGVEEKCCHEVFFFNPHLHKI